MNFRAFPDYLEVAHQMILELGDRLHLIISILLLSNNYLFAHNPNEAFFTISYTGDYIEIIAELPWSLRNDLMLFNPKLEKSKNDQDFKDSFKEYIQQKLILRNTSGEIIPLLSLNEESHNGHSHQNSFRLIYQEGQLHQVENTVLFTSYKNQKNHHFLIKKNETITKITYLNVPSFTIDNKDYKKQHRSKYWPIILVLLISISGLFYLKKKPS